MQRGACAAVDLLAGVVTLQGPALEQPAPEGLPSVGLVLEQLRKNCSLWKGYTLEKFVEDWFLWEWLHTGTEEEREMFSLWGSRTNIESVWWTYHSPHFLSPCAAGGEKVENLGMKLRNKRVVGGQVFFWNLALVSHKPTLFRLVINYLFNFFPLVLS